MDDIPSIFTKSNNFWILWPFEKNLPFDIIINEDIIAQLGYTELDSYIGDPSGTDRYSYPRLTQAAHDYWRKYDDKNNFNEYSVIMDTLNRIDSMSDNEELKEYIFYMYINNIIYSISFDIFWIVSTRFINCS